MLVMRKLTLGCSMEFLSREDLYRLVISIALAIRSLDLFARLILSGHLITRYPLA